jgi:hypothetical protein
MKFDKTTYKINSFEEADLQRDYWQSKSYDERLAAASQMIKISYGLVGKPEPRMEKILTDIIKRDGQDF